MPAAKVRRISDGRQQFDQATKDIRFAKDFIPALEALMADQLATHAERIMAWIKRYSWGNFSLFCVDEKTKQPRYQVHCARELGLDARKVSAAVSYLETRGYLERAGKLLYPVIAPVLGGPHNPNCKIDEKSWESGTFRTFVEEWKVSHSQDFSQLEVLRSEVKRIQKVLLSDYKKWRTSRTNGGPSLYERVESIESRQAGSLGIPEEPPQPPACLPPEPLPKEPEPEPQAETVDDLEIALVNRGFPNARFDQIRKVLKNTPLDVFFQILDQRLDRARQTHERIGPGLLVHVARDAVAAFAKIQATRAAGY